MKVLVTGGAGFVGSHIAERLINDGHSVIVYDDFSTGKRENLPASKLLSIVEGDIRDFDFLLRHMKSVDYVFHEAAIASVPKTVGDPLGSSTVNYMGTLNVLESAKRSGVKRVVFASSAAVYGDEPTLPKVETMLPVTLSPYSVDKLASEYACKMYGALYGLETVCLRYFNVYGPRQDPSSPYSGVISIFIDKLQCGDAPTIYGDGEQTRDFVNIADVVNANMSAMIKGRASGHVLNVATGEQRTLNEVLSELYGIYGKPFEALYESPRSGDIRESYANISTAELVLNWAPKVDFRQGLKELVELQ